MADLYAAFDDYFKISTWHTDHPADIKRFNEALAKVVKHPDFNEQGLREYIEKKIPAEKLGEDSSYHQSIDRLACRADYVRQYLEDTGAIDFPKARDRILRKGSN